MNETMIKPYGDTLNDGIVQLSFTLPIENSERAKKAAEIYVAHLNFKNISVVHSEKISDNFTNFIVYAKAIPTIDYNKIDAKEIETENLNFYEINKRIEQQLNRKLVVVGATVGSDAHTVGIDAIMNMKGYNHDYGLERYPMIRAFNMGAQVSVEELIGKAVEISADVILVSQTVTQKDIHVRNFTQLVELLEAENIRNRFILLAGGAQVTNDFAVKIGYDAGFGRGTKPSVVGSFLITRMSKMGKRAYRNGS